MLCVFGSQTFNQFHGCARSKPQFLTAVPEVISGDAGVQEWKEYQQYKYGTVSWDIFTFLLPE